MNVVGGFQVQGAKVKCDNDQNQNAAFVGNSKQDRIECERLEHIRTAHAGARKIYDEHPEWVYMPIPTHHELVPLFKSLVEDRQLRIPEPLQDGVPLVFFTDGKSVNPKEPRARRASWR